MRPVRPKTPRKTVPKSKASAKDPILVYCRIRPLENSFDPVCVKAKDDTTVALFPPDVSQNAKSFKEIHYTFQYVFPETTTQKELFENVSFPLVQDLLNGNNGLLFTYGITSSGKTYTMAGTPQDGGLLPRTLDVVFNSIKDYQAAKYVFKPDKLNGFDIQSRNEALFDQQKEITKTPKTPKRKENVGEWSQRIADSTIIDDVCGDMNYAVFISYVEIYNNYIYDLLEDATFDPKRKTFNSKMLREDSAHNMYVFGVVENEVKTVDEALALFCKGQQKRKVANTALNTESSRSHSIFTIRVVQAPLDPQGAEILQDKDQIIISQLSLVDLAGSERPLRTRNTGQKLREAGNINNSLMALRNCIEALRDSQTQACSKMIPYRESKLTHLFKTYFEGEGKIRMVVCVNPHADDYDEIVHVMKFAEKTRDVLISRPTPVSTPLSLALKPGRGNIYKEAIKRAKEQGVHVTEVLGPVVYSLGPDFPSLSIHMFDDESVYTNLIDFLESRISRRNTFFQDITRRQDDFRNNLQAIDKENVQLKQEKTILQMDLDAREEQVRSLERKLSSTEQSYEILANQYQETQNQIQNYRLELDSRERKISDQGKEIEYVKIRMQEKLASEKDRLKRIMERRLAAKQAELERKMCFTDEKFRQLREILNADDWEYIGDIVAPPVPPSVTSTATSESSAPESHRPKRRSLDEPSASNPKFTKTKSELDFRSSRHNTPQSGQQPSKNEFDDLFAKENKPPSSSQRSVAIANLRHRRSQSSSGVWIEHKPIENLPLTTVLQPTMKKKKSVSKLNVKDVTNADVSKYVLQHQEQDSQGEMETQLYKGDVIPSAGGGAQVVFNDVEKLRQESPPMTYNLRKRSGDSVPLREVEDRCTVSVECHGYPSKILKKKRSN
ncbi:Kinesin-like protein KIF23 [Araneus ventricosus]|uniref:Kinesin-like protein n=1 Tax=Araneus ventricosus TaxID=182803 RepID=A0A4Y2JAZ1_ARAVE|nr:Kinesin-like protein KIF23 [Araneus ventricosus]